jgi:putative hydrolase of the HAD superfamily
MTLKTNKYVIFDLDDTLYKEIDFLKSAFNEIAIQISAEVSVAPSAIFAAMLSIYEAKKNVFEEIINKYSSSYNKLDLLNIYRSHFPKIAASKEVIDLLNILKDNNVRLGVLTDGRSVQQRNKLKALGLNGFFSEIIISEEFGSEKPNIKNYKHFENSFGKGDYFYIGDNLKKDFISPNKLNWTTICLLDDGANIHEQNFNLPLEYLPRYKVETLREIQYLISF